MKQQLQHGVAVGAAMVLGVLAVKWLTAVGVVQGDHAEIVSRSFNVTLGILVAAMANVAPKRLRPLNELRCEPRREQGFRRASAVIIMAGGAVYSLVWIAAPAALATPLSIAALATSLLTVVLLCASAASRRNSDLRQGS